ncbi:MAG: Calx-beta domain-containing protein [Hyphomicrobium sp.]
MAFGISAISGAEDAGTISFTVFRTHSGLLETVLVSTIQNQGFSNLSDYSPFVNFAVTFQSFEASKSFTFNILADTLVEPNETFGLLVETTAGGFLASTTFTIFNDDVAPVPPNISIGNSTVTEGGQLAFSVTLDRPATQAIALHYATIVGTASQAAGDYTGTIDSIITIPAGTTAGTIFVQTTPDTAVEANETMQVRLLSTSYGSIIDNTGQGVILNNDAAPVAPNISIGNSTVVEGGRLAFSVTLDRPATQAIALHYATIVGTASQAAGDYTGTIDSIITIPAGTTAGTIFVQTTPDATFEPNETMQVRLLSTSYGSIVDNAGVGVILNNDTAPLASAQTLFGKSGGELLTLAHFANAAYRGTSDLALLESTGWNVLELPGIAFTAVGHYENSNAGALVARASDALVVSFRGTDSFTDAALDWVGTRDHYENLLRPFLDAVHAYLIGPNGIRAGINKVYVTGHSLGAALAQAYLEENKLSPIYHGVGFANPGFGAPDSSPAIVGSFTNFWVESDPIRGAYAIRGKLGDGNVIRGNLHGDGALLGIDSHKMEIYSAYVSLMAMSGANFNDVGNMLVTGSYNSLVSNVLVFNSGRSFIAGSGADTLSGTLGRDIVLGGAENDILNGGFGPDLRSDLFADRLYGGAGSDTYDVKDSIDVVIEKASEGVDSIRSGTVSVNLANYLNVENIVLTGSAALNGTGNAANNVVIGNSGANILIGAGGNDTLIGGAGQDMLYGNEPLTARDTFRFSVLTDSAVSGTLCDVILGFDAGGVSTDDKIDLSFIDANPGLLAFGNQSFVFRGGAAFTAAAGEIRVIVSGLDSFVLVDTDADAAWEMAIKVAGVTGLSGADFVL